jgi:hypothetical protein
VRDRQFAINTPGVVSEIIDGEVVIMSLASGNYYSSDNVGAVIWGWIGEGKTCGDIERLMLDRYDATADILARDLGAFLDRLLQEQLIREVAPGEARAAGHANGHDCPSRERFVTPELHVYTDMQDLLLLDPIHDVDEAGWPRPRGDAPGHPDVDEAGWPRRKGDAPADRA